MLKVLWNPSESPASRPVSRFGRSGRGGLGYVRRRPPSGFPTEVPGPATRSARTGPFASVVAPSEASLRINKSSTLSSGRCWTARVSPPSVSSCAAGATSASSTASAAFRPRFDALSTAITSPPAGPSSPSRFGRPVWSGWETTSAGARHPGSRPRWDMTRSSDAERAHRALRERLSRRSEASLRINESPEVRHCPPGGAGRRASLPGGASSGVSTLFNDSGAVDASPLPARRRRRWRA